MSEKCLSLKLLNSKASKVSTHFYTKFGIKIKNLVLCWCYVDPIQNAGACIHQRGQCIHREIEMFYRYIW